MNTRIALLDVAERFARSAGYDAFSYADIAAALNIRKPSIHHHFPTKADLALALIARYRAAFGQALEGIEGHNAAQQLIGFIALYRTALGKGDQLCLCIAFASHRDSFNPATRAEINGFHRDVLNWLADLFALGQIDGSLPNADPVAAAHACLAQVQGAQIMARAAREPALFDRATATLLPM